VSTIEIAPALDQTLFALRVHPWKVVLLESRMKRPPLGAPCDVTTVPQRIVAHVTADRNIGNVCHESTGLMVLDPDKLDLWHEMTAELGEPGKPWVRTGSGKFHFYVQWLPHMPAKLWWSGRIIGELQRGNTVPGVEGQQQVVLPPSVHPETGRRYEWLVDPAAEKLGPLPPLWAAYLHEDRPSKNDEAPPEPSPDAPQHIAAALRQPGAKRRANGSVKFQCAGCLAEGHDKHRDNAIVWASGKFGCAVGGRAHNRAIWRQLDVVTSGRRDETGYEPRDGHHGDHHDEYRGGDSAPGPTLAIMGGGAFIAQTFPESTHYIDGILSDDGGGWISGEEKTNKTWWMEAEATSLALAKPLAGRFAVPQRRRALILEEEDSPRRTHRRIRAVLRGHGIDPDDPAAQADLDAWLRISVWSGFTLDNALLVAQLDAAIKDFRPAVVYIDCLRKVTMKNLNHADEAGALLAILDDLRRRYDVIFRLVHHYRKQQGFRTGRGSQEIGGSFVLGAWGENSLFFEPIGRKQGAVRVEVQSKDGTPVPGFTLTIESEGPSHAPDLVRLVATHDVDPNDVDEIVYQAVAALPKIDAVKGAPGVPFTTIRDAVKKGDKTVRRSLDRLVAGERCLVTGTTTKQAKLYAVNA
jgi:hypothetical protein